MSIRPRRVESTVSSDSEDSGVENSLRTEVSTRKDEGAGGFDSSACAEGAGWVPACGGLAI
jgi:hypothetical protein